MLPKSDTVKLVSIVFGGLPSLFLAYLAFIALAVSLTMVTADASFSDFKLAIASAMGLFGTGSLWTTILDIGVLTRFGRFINGLGLIAGVCAATFVGVSLGLAFPTDEFGLGLLFCLLGTVSVAIYHLIYLIQRELHSDDDRHP